MTSVTQICNLALLRVGGQTIANITELSREAQLCGVFYEQCRDQLLRTFPWNFARRRVVLARAASTATNWAYAYVCPTDCLQALRILVPGLGMTRTGQTPPFEVGSAPTGRIVYTNQALAELEYTARIEDPSLMDPLFANVLGWLLASELATALTAKPELADLARKAYQATLAEAAEQSKAEGSEGIAVDRDPQVEICNLALLRVGGKTIASLSEGSREAQLCSVFLGKCRDQILRAFPWNFARRRAVLLPRVASVTNWANAYTCPADCLQALRLVLPGVRLGRVDQTIPFELASSGTDRVIYTDASPAELEYTARVEAPEVADPLFSNVLSWLLAAELAMPLTAKPELAALARQGYAATLNEAAAQSLNEGHAGIAPECELLTVRR